MVNWVERTFLLLNKQHVLPLSVVSIPGKISKFSEKMCVDYTEKESKFY